MRDFGRERQFGENHGDGRQLAILPTSGFASNGKPIFDWDEAAQQLTRGGNSWSFSLGSPVTVSYAFRSTTPAVMPDGISGFQRFNAQQIAVAEATLQLWADVANITFVRVGSGTSGPTAYSNNATILFANYTTETDPAAAFAFLPSPNATGANQFAGDIWVDISDGVNVNPTFGEYGAQILAHEIGHAIGLRHPGNYDGGTPTYAADAIYWQDARMFTVMTYFGSMNAGGNLPSFAWGPQYHDIAAIQRLYGANMSTRADDTTYGFNSTAGRELYAINSASQGVTFSIWDGGGVDTFDLSGYGQDAEIDLRPGSFSSAGPTPDNGPAHLNLSIAVGVTIENAIGGFGDDRIIGNDVANILTGNSGDDWLTGGLGNDSLFAGAGNDRTEGGDGNDLIKSGPGNDTLLGDAGDDTLGASNRTDLLRGFDGDDLLLGSNGNDRLFGGDGADTLLGGNGRDTLTGEAGPDRLRGDGGSDLFLYAKGGGADVIVDFEGGVSGGDVLRISGFGQAVDSFADIMALAVQSGPDVVIDLGGGDSVILLRTDLLILDSGDFRFG